MLGPCLKTIAGFAFFALYWHRNVITFFLQKHDPTFNKK